ncbi:MAG: TonB-dependent receptor [Rikenellaceae bacterium]|nr:TonB-dependent receptor [Rikenellaceae bacterium]
MKNFSLKFVLTVVLGWSLAFAAEAQTLRGGVKDAKGEPVIGAAVVVAGTSLGTSTGVDGSFTLNVPDAKNNSLVVSYIGMKTQTVPVNGRTEIQVVLEEDATGIEDVVVVGYGTVKRRDLTGSVASVSGEKLAANPVSNVAQALQGQLPGVQVTSQDGRPGASMSIRVRGGGSITQSNDPLFIVDGIQVSDISDIPADNIESIDVLKDAASTAIYGASGANGVILITTKGGQKDQKTTVRYNMYYQIKAKPEILDVMDAYDYVLYTWAQGMETGATYADGVARYFGLGSKYGNHLNDYKNVKSHNYMEDVLRQAYSQSHDISMSTGNEKSQLYATVNYVDDEGSRINSGYRRWGANIKFSHKLAKTLTFDADLRYSDTKLEGTKYDVATSSYKYRPIDEPMGEDNEALMFQGGDGVSLSKNPVDVINNYENITTRQRLRARGGLTWQPIKGLTAKSELSLSRNWSQTEYWDAGTNASDNAYNEARLTKQDGYGVRWATTVNYEVQGLGEDHSLSVLAGNELLASKSNKSEFRGYGYPDGFSKDDAFGMMNMYDDNVKPSSFSNTIGTPDHTTSWFGRVNYGYKGKYLFTATFRADGSSKFAENNQWGYFPAAAVAWRISDEAFMEGARDWLDNLKLRVSYGTSGADNIDSSLWKGTWKTSTNAAGETVYVPGDMQPNPDLKWETTTSRNIGVDFSFWNGRLRGSIDGYWNSTNDILMKVPTDASSGYSFQYRNVAETSNKGIEIALGADIIRKKDFNLSFNMTYSYNKNNIEAIDDKALADAHTNWGSTARFPNYDYVIREGQPVGTVMGFVADGFYTTADFDYANGVYTLKPGVPDVTASIVSYQNFEAAGGMKEHVADGQLAYPGMPKFKDIDGNGVLDLSDETIVGEMMANHSGGFSLSGNWKNLDFSAAFTYQIGGKVYNANAMQSLWGNKDNNLGSNHLALTADCYQIYGVDANGDLGLVWDPAQLDAMNKDAKQPMAHSQFALVSSDFIEDASYLRLQNLTVGYTLPKKWTSKVKIEKVRVYFTGSNLFCLSGYSGLDPEVNTNFDAGGDGFPTPNYDYNAYPKTSTYTFGLNVTF